MTEPPPPSRTELCDYVCAMHVQGANRPGVVARAAQLFAERGISLGEVLATDHAGLALLLLRFRTSARLRDFMTRRLERMPEVTAVRLLPASNRPLWQYLDEAANP